MQIKSKVLTIRVVTFLVHITIALTFWADGKIAKDPFFGSRPSTDDLFAGDVAILFGIILFIISVYMLTKKNFQSHIVLVCVTTTSVFIWFLIEKSGDIILFLFVYLIIFIPLSIYRYKLDKRI